MSSQPPPAQMHARHGLEVSSPCSSTAIPSPSIPIHPGTLILSDSRSEGLPAAENSARQVISIDTLRDDFLLTIFDHCVGGNPLVSVSRREIEAWQPLVQVCQRWRSVVFRSSRRLNLRLWCTSRTPREALDVWPALPFVISDRHYPANGSDNIVKLLEHSDRVCQINFMNIPSLQVLNPVLQAMQKPFPELTDLLFWSLHETMPVVPNAFLGGFVPRLRNLSLDAIPFPSLPNLLLSATHLVGLYLLNIPRSGYFSPEAMLAALSTLTSLKSLYLQFQFPGCRPHRASRHPPPMIRPVLPVLTELLFEGVSEYLEVLVARIEAPRLSTLKLTFFNQIAFDTPHLAKFISCTPRMKGLRNAHVVFSHRIAKVALSSQNSGHQELIVDTLCGVSDRQLLSLKQICTFLPPLSTSEYLYIYEDPYSPVEWEDNIEIMAWLGLLRAFTAVKNLYLSEQFTPSIAPALQELVGGRTTEVLPALQNVFLEGFEPSEPVQEGIEQFVAARQVTGHPIVVACWERHDEEDEDEDEDDEDDYEDEDDENDDDGYDDEDEDDEGEDDDDDD